jgi:hypothetical protein
MLFVISFFAFCLVMTGMALGVLLGRRPIAGSCGRDCGCHGVNDER